MLGPSLLLSLFVFDCLVFPQSLRLSMPFLFLFSFLYFLFFERNNSHPHGQANAPLVPSAMRDNPQMDRRWATEYIRNDDDAREFAAALRDGSAIHPPALQFGKPSHATSYFIPKMGTPPPWVHTAPVHHTEQEHCSLEGTRAHPGDYHTIYSLSVHSRHSFLVLGKDRLLDRADLRSTVRYANGQ